MLSLVIVSPVITAFRSCCLSHHVFDQVNLWPDWVGIETAIFWQCSPGTVETQRLLSAAPRAPNICFIFNNRFAILNYNFVKVIFLPHSYHSTYRHCMLQEGSVRKGCLTFQNKGTEDCCRRHQHCDRGKFHHNPRGQWKDTLVVILKEVESRAKYSLLQSCYFLTFNKQIKRVIQIIRKK